MRLKTVSWVDSIFKIWISWLWSVCTLLFQKIFVYQRQPETQKYQIGLHQCTFKLLIVAHCSESKLSINFLTVAACVRMQLLALILGAIWILLLQTTNKPTQPNNENSSWHSVECAKQ